MFKHLLTLMWNKRRANGMIFLEVVLAFIVLFGVYAFGFYNLERYNSPLGFSYENSLGVRVDLDDELDSTAVYRIQERILREANELPGVASATWIGMVNPFGGSNWGSGNNGKGFDINTALLFADENFDETMELEFREGRWFTMEDRNGKYRPMVINGAFVDQYYPDAETMIDSTFALFGDEERIVVGVVDEFKYRSNFSEREPLTFYDQDVFETYDDEEKGLENLIEQPFEMMIVRAESGRLAEVEEPLFRMLVDQTKQTDVVIWNMAKDRIKANRPITLPLIILALISGFLLINIALGLFGVLFTQINRRRAEIGLRKALGASAGQISAQFITEVLMVAGAGILVGALFAVQVPLLDLLPLDRKFFFYGMLAATLTILLIVLICTLWPSRQAARLQPALVLHEE